MDVISAFVGHSFDAQDKEVVDRILAYLNTVKRTLKNFDWQNAIDAQPSQISEKVKEIIQNKNLFIGICTKKELVINERNLKRIAKLKYADANAFQWKASDWVLQELGYCLGRGMKAIILLEKNVRPIFGLHADLEYIEFDRENVDRCFEKLLQQLVSLTPSNLSSNENRTSEVSSHEDETEKTIPTEKKEIDYKTPQSNWQYEDYWVALYLAISENDSKQEDSIFNAGKQKFIDKDEAAAWEAEYLYWKGTLRNEPVQEKLELIARTNPQNIKVKLTLAWFYSKFGSIDKAASIALEAAEIENKFMSPAFRAALNHLKNDKGEGVAIKWLLAHKQKFNKNDDDFVISFFEEYANLVKKNDPLLYIPIAEAILNNAPDRGSIRFDLAYVYSEMGLHNFAAHHYKIICEASRTNDVHMSLNNLAVAYENLGLSIESVKFYKRAAKEKNTLAMSNLASRFANAGFLEESQTLCEEAIKEKDYDKRVLTAIDWNNQRIEFEKNFLTNLNDDLKANKNFYIAFGLSLNRDTSLLRSGFFEGPDCTFDIKINGTEFNAYSVSEKNVDSVTESPSSGLLGSTNVAKDLTITFNGSILGLGIRGKIERSSSSKASTALSISGFSNNAETLIYYDTATFSYKVAEISSDNKLNKIYDLKPT